MTSREAINKYFQIKDKGTRAEIAAMFPQLGRGGIDSMISNMSARGQLSIAAQRSNNSPAVYKLNKQEDASRDLDIVEQCRQNWQGYRIHKVFGAAGRVTA